MLRLLISGGPGSGCTSTAVAVGVRLGLPVFDSDAYFHKPTDPPFQYPYAPDERRFRMAAALGAESSWILSGSIATWGLDSLCPTHGVFLDMPVSVRRDRLLRRQSLQFGARIDAGGDLYEEHESFLRWAAEYDDRTGPVRNSATDRAFLEMHCQRLLLLKDVVPIDEVVSKVLRFLLPSHSVADDSSPSSMHHDSP